MPNDYAELIVNHGGFMSFIAADCGTPGQIQYASISLSADRSLATYRCERWYSFPDGNRTKSIRCVDSAWSLLPGTCMREYSKIPLKCPYTAVYYRDRSQVFSLFLTESTSTKADKTSSDFLPIYFISIHNVTRS